MSAIGDRLFITESENITLNSLIFATALMAYLLNDITAVQARNFVNQHILENFGEVLSAQEEADIGVIKTFYDGLSAALKSEFRDKLISYTLILQNGLISVEFWDEEMGL